MPVLLTDGLVIQQHVQGHLANLGDFVRGLCDFGTRRAIAYEASDPKPANRDINGR